MKSLIRIFNGIAIIIVLIIIWIFFTIYPITNSTPQIIGSDGYGYYSYLPSMIIYHDLSCGFLPDIRTRYPDFNIPQYINYVHESAVNKYFCGVAVMQLPFFLTAHIVSKICNVPADGYSFIYQYFVFAAAMFYLWLGLVYFRRFLLLYNIAPWAIAISGVALVFATNLYHYVLTEPSMSHVYSLCLITMFCYYAKSFFAVNSRNTFYALCAVAGLMILVRPINGIVLLALPFLSGSGASFISGIRFLLKNFHWFLIGLLIVVNIAIIQCYLWMLQAGEFVVWSYGTYEGFDLAHPQIRNVLFSFRKGLFIWTPVLSMAVVGFVSLFNKSKFQFAALLLFLFVVVYALSSWREWYYGMSFGFRPMIDYYVFCFFLLALLLNTLRLLRTKIVVVLVVALFIHVNTVQAYQYRNYILHWKDMTYEKYKTVFMKTDKQWEGYLWSNVFYDDYYDVFFTRYKSSAHSFKVESVNFPLTLLPGKTDEELFSFDSGIDTIPSTNIVVRIKLDIKDIDISDLYLKFKCVMTDPGKPPVILHEEKIFISSNARLSKFAFLLKVKPKGKQSLKFFLSNENNVQATISDCEIDLCKPLN